MDSDNTIISESSQSADDAGSPILTGLHDIIKQKQMDFNKQIHVMSEDESSDDESQMSQSLLKPKSHKVYRSPVFSPPASKIPKKQERENVNDIENSLTVNAPDKVVTKYSTENDYDSDCTEIEEDRNDIIRRMECVGTISQVIETISPVIEIISPVIETLSPVIETMSPVMETVSLVTETISPVMETISPVVETISPVMETISPVIETISPVIETMSPVVETISPVIDTEDTQITCADGPQVFIPKISGQDNNYPVIMRIETPTTSEVAEIREEPEISVETRVKECKSAEVRRMKTENETPDKATLETQHKRNDKTVRKRVGRNVREKADKNTDEEMSAETWEVVDQDHKDLMELETKLERLKNGSEPGINSKLLSIKMQLKFMNDSFKAEQKGVLDKLAKLQREFNKNRQREKLENIKAKQKILLKLVKIYRIISNENELSSSSTPERSSEGRSQHVNQSKKGQHLQEDIQEGPTDLPKRKKSTNVDLNLVVQKLVSAGLVTSTPKTISHISESAREINKEKTPSQGTCTTNIDNINNVGQKSLVKTAAMTSAVQEDVTECNRLYQHAKILPATPTALASLPVATTTKTVIIIGPVSKTTTTVASNPINVSKVKMKGINRGPQQLFPQMTKSTLSSNQLAGCQVPISGVTAMSAHWLNPGSPELKGPHSMSVGGHLKSAKPGAFSTSVAPLVPINDSTNVVASNSLTVGTSANGTSADQSPSTPVPPASTSSTSLAKQVLYDQPALASVSSVASFSESSAKTSNDGALRNLLNNCRISLIDDGELFPSKRYLPDLFWTDKFESIELPPALIDDIDKWN
ncbi:uncharacterized protein [Antedon mediterranea]|uniref:uncharacterized protein n=1 Tax=Antedon mediterranea TaxID=105859 RepID=UPI003AF9E50F